MLKIMSVGFSPPRPLINPNGSTNWRRVFEVAEGRWIQRTYKNSNAAQAMSHYLRRHFKGVMIYRQGKVLYVKRG